MRDLRESASSGVCFHFLKARFYNIRYCFLVGKDCSLFSISAAIGLPTESGWWWWFVAVKRFVELCATLGNHVVGFCCELRGCNHLPSRTCGFPRSVFTTINISQSPIACGTISIADLDSRYHSERPDCII
jgi:hypothetical protein